jgi:hypothetical protein
MTRPNGVKSTPVTADTTIKSSPGRIWWITISNSHATESTQVELEDTGTDRWGVNVEAVDLNGQPFHAVFDPPIICDTGITIDISNGTVKATVGWT